MNMNNDNFKLPSNIHENTYNDIKIATLDNKAHKLDHPTIVVLGGQPGAGKSALIDAARAEQPVDRAPVVINGDDFRRYHPKHSEIFKNHPRDGATLTDPDTREWTRRVLEEAKDGRYNIIFESTMRQASPLDQTMQRFRDDGYKVEVKVMAAHEDLSTLGIRGRYESQIEKQGFGRWTQASSHDETYRSMPETLDKIEREKLSDRIQVYNRAGEVIYENRLTDGKWEREPGAKTAVLAERERPLSLPEVQHYNERWNIAIQKMVDRNAPPSELTEARAIQASFKERHSPEIKRQEPTNVVAQPSGPKTPEEAQSRQWSRDDYSNFANQKDQHAQALKSQNAPDHVVSDHQARASDAKDAINKFERSAERDPRVDPVASRTVHEAAQRAESSGKSAKDHASFSYENANLSRQQAFDNLPQLQALSKHPELDGAYKHLSNLQHDSMGLPQGERNRLFNEEKQRLSADIGRGSIPKSDVSITESKQVIDRAINERGLIVRDGRELNGVQQGTVVAESSRHILVESGTIGIRYEKNTLSREVQPGDKVALQNGKDGNVKVISADEQKQIRTMDRSHQYERDISR
jgi:hypothetical protein